MAGYTRRWLWWLDANAPRPIIVCSGCGSTSRTFKRVYWSHVFRANLCNACYLAACNKQREELAKRIARVRLAHGQ
ncbi:MAG: hypothetical protein ACXABY_09140 [Candidatus Thorarchaeota archaeon]